MNYAIPLMMLFVGIVVSFSIYLFLKSLITKRRRKPKRNRKPIDSPLSNKDIETLFVEIEEYRREQGKDGQ